ncbi:MAG: permease-like cell division protein FtsX [Oscillospiraceae bacterium]
MRTSNASYLVKKGLASVWKNFIMSFASFSIMMVSLLQISCAVLLMMNMNVVMGNIEETNEITIYVKEGASESQVEHINQVLLNNGNLTDIKYYSKEDALEDFRNDMAEYAELLDYLEDNPMPETFLVRVIDLSEIRATVTAIQGIEGVEQVKAPYEFAGALVNIRSTFSVIIIGVLIVLVIVSIVIVSNTIRTSVFSRRTEITIMKYVGATDGFIKLPFFVEGCFVGITAGAAAWGITWFVYKSIYDLFANNMTLQMFGFFNLIPFEQVRWILLGACCLAGAFMAAVGTMISMGKYLKV